MLRRTLSLYFAFLLLTLSSFAQDKNLARSVTIYRDNYGVPHIFGKTDAAVVFGLMYAECEDNLWQLETDFIRSTGRAAELDGEKGLSNDLAYRAFEVERLSKAEYERLPKKAKELCDAYAAGLNYFLYYVHGNAVPKRSPKFDWTKQVDGGDPETEWNGYHTLDELPHLLNPKSGFLQNCNSTPFLMTDEGNPRKEDFPAYLAPEADTPRAKSSRRILTSKAKFTFDEWAEAATNTMVNEAPPITTRMITAWFELRETDKARFEKLAPALKELADWKFIARIDSVPTTLFVLTHEKLKNKDDDPLEKLEETMADLEKSFGAWRVAWGEINRLQRVHTSGDEPFSDERPSLPVAGGPGPAGVVFTYSARPEKGQKRRYGTAGNSFVAVVEFGKQPRARSVLVFGQSPDPASKHHLDQAELYAQGKFKPVRFTLREIKANLERAYAP